MKIFSRHHKILFILSGTTLASVLLILFIINNAQEQIDNENLLANLETIRRDSSIILAPCTTNDSRYTMLFFKRNPLELWPSLYSQKVSGVLEESLQPIKPENIDCTSDTPITEDALPQLQALAASLPPWQSMEHLSKLKNTDIGFVLLEYLRVYECALKEKELFLRQSILDAQWQNLENPEIINSEPREIREGEVLAKYEYEKSIIKKELALSRPLLEKALMIQTGKTKLNILDAELICMQRSSLDIRNGLALSADASACLPRIWNAKDVLRDINESFYPTAP